MGARGPLKLVAPSPDPTVAPKPGGPDTAASMMTPSAPDKPERLPEEVSELWDTIVDSLDKAGMIARCDGPTMELALRHFVAARVASDEIIYGSATMHDDKNDRPMKNPASQVFRDHSTAYLEFAKQLGLTFVARARTPIKTTGDGDSDNPFS